MPNGVNINKEGIICKLKVEIRFIINDRVLLKGISFLRGLRLGKSLGHFCFHRSKAVSALFVDRSKAVSALFGDCSTRPSEAVKK